MSATAPSGQHVNGSSDEKPPTPGGPLPTPATPERRAALDDEGEEA
jgi:hypothetical protein